MSDREERFEKMMQSVLDSYGSAVEKMDKLKQEGKTNTVTYKQLMAEKLKNQNIISLYNTLLKFCCDYHCKHLHCFILHI